MKSWQIDKARRGNLNILKHMQKQAKNERVDSLVNKFKKDIKRKDKPVKEDNTPLVQSQIKFKDEV